MNKVLITFFWFIFMVAAIIIFLNPGILPFNNQDITKPAIDNTLIIEGTNNEGI